MCANVEQGQFTESDSGSVDGASRTQGRFRDLFAGCGGLSLGLVLAGWRGELAVEKDPDAFKTIQTNLLQNRSREFFSWPKEIPQKPLRISALLNKYIREIRALRGKVDLIAGGPPPRVRIVVAPI